MAERVLGQQPSIKHSTIPEQGEWFIDEVADWYSYAKEWEQAKDDPWIIFHTSGTTGIWFIPIFSISMAILSMTMGYFPVRFNSLSVETDLPICRIAQTGHLYTTNDDILRRRSNDAQGRAHNSV